MKTIRESIQSFIIDKVFTDEFQLTYQEEEIHLKVAKLVENLRTQQGITQVELARRAGVSQPMIARLEKGDQDRVPTLSTIHKIFGALGYKIELKIKEII